MTPTPFSYLDLAGFTARTVMPLSDVQLVTGNQPGWYEAAEAQFRTRLNARLRKRYAVPFGRSAPPLQASGTAPPPVTLAGVPTRGCLAIVLAILTAGALGSSSFAWSADAGQTWSMATTMAATGTSPPPVGVQGTSTLSVPSSLVVRVTAGGTLGTAQFQWSTDGGADWNVNPVLVATGTTPPAATISGLSTLPLITSLQIQITSAGALGTAAFRWSLNGGTTWSNAVTASAVPLPGTGLTVSFPPGIYATNNVYVGQGVTTAASVPLTGTGLTAQFPAGTYATDNVYEAEPPVPQAVLSWMTAILTEQMYKKRGRDAADPAMVDVTADAKLANDEITEAANSQTGLYDLPLNDAVDATGVSKGGPLSYTETSPYIAADIQEQLGRAEDWCNR